MSIFNSSNSDLIGSNETNPSSYFIKQFKPVFIRKHLIPYSENKKKGKSALRLNILKKNFSEKKFNSVKLNDNYFPPSNNNSFCKKKSKKNIKSLFKYEKDLKKNYSEKRFNSVQLDNKYFPLLSNSSSTNSILKKKITLNTIKNELEYLNKFIKNSPISKDENEINKNLRIKNSKFKAKNSNNLNYYNINNNEQITIKNKKIINENDPNYKKYINTANNPCIGLEGRKKFKQYTKYIKYNQTFSNYYSTKNLNTTTLALRVGLNNYLNGNYDLKNKNNLTKATIFKLKCKTINWFIENQKDLINRLFDEKFKENLLNFCEKKQREFHSGLSIEDFSNILINNNITKNLEFIHKIFWVFDEDGDNNLSFNDIIAGIEVFRISSPEEKMKIFFNLCNKEKEDTIKKKDFYELLQKNIIDKNDLKDLKYCINNLFEKYGKNNLLRLSELIFGFSEDKLFQRIINNNILSLKTINNNLDDSIRRHFLLLHANYQYEITKMLNKNNETIPILTDRFIDLIDKYIQGKKNAENLKKKNQELINEDLYDNNENKRDNLFQEEKKICFNMKLKNKIRGIKIKNDYYILPKSSSNKDITDIY